MSEFSLSFHEDTSFNIDHDNRKYLSKNIIPERVADNISYAGNIPIEQFYEETFQKSYEEFIQKQIAQRHSDKVKDWPATYYERVIQEQTEKDKAYQEALARGVHKKELNGRGYRYTKVAKQIIVQIGNADDMQALEGAQKEELQAKMVRALKEYMETFQKENPNFRIVNAVIHVDEIGETPHLHLTYVPVAYEQKRGMKTSNALEAALKAMGITADKKKQPDGTFMTAQTKWQMKERDRMIAIAAEHGLSAGYEKGAKGQHYDIQAYREIRQQERDAQAQLQEAQAQLQYAEAQEKLSLHNEEIIAQQGETIQQQQSQIAENKTVIAEMGKKLAGMQECVEETTEVFDKKSEDLYNTIVALDTQIDNLEQKKAEVKAEEKRVNELAETADELEGAISSVSAIYQKKMEELLNAVSPSDDYERVNKGFGSSKRTFVMVPEEQYKVLERRNNLSKQTVTNNISEIFTQLANAIKKVPLVQYLRRIIKKKNEELARQQEMNDKLVRRNTELERKAIGAEQMSKVTDKLLADNLHLSPEKIAGLKARVAKEIAQNSREDDDIKW